MISDTYRNELNQLLSNPDARPAQITAARGRYIIALNRDIRNTNDLQTVNYLRNESRMQMTAHHQQLNNRLNHERHSNGLIVTQIANEIVLKNRRIANSARQFAYSNSASEYVANGARVVGNTVSAAISVAKIPLMATVRIASLAAPVLPTIAVQPLQIPAYVFTKVINPDAKYNGQVITNMGREIGNLVLKNEDYGIIILSTQSFPPRNMLSTTSISTGFPNRVLHKSLF